MDHQFYIERKRKLVNENIAKPIRDAAIIQLLILKDGPRDLRKVEAFIKELKRKQDRANNMRDALHYMTELEGYEWLLDMIEDGFKVW